jgi:hypothetical protein
MYAHSTQFPNVKSIGLVSYLLTKTSLYHTFLYHG